MLIAQVAIFMISWICNLAPWSRAGSWEQLWQRTPQANPSQFKMHPMKPTSHLQARERAFSEFLLVEATATLRLQSMYLDAGARLCWCRSSSRIRGDAFCA